VTVPVSRAFKVKVMMMIMMMGNSHHHCLFYMCVLAGSIMYEYALRLARDCPGLKGIQGQAKCLLAAMNALRLGDPKYAWVTRPVMPGDDDDDDDNDDDDDGEFSSPPKRPRGVGVTDSVSCCLMCCCLKVKWTIPHSRRSAHLPFRGH